MKNLANRLWKDESGISATEYGILAALLGAGLIAVLTAFSDEIKNLFTEATSDISNL